MARRTFNDWYAFALMLSLLGYVFIGRGFAYQGLPPLFVGELLLLSGLAAYLISGRIFAPLAAVPTQLLIILMIWVLLRTIPFIGIYGMDAPRDSVVIMYGVFAFIVIALVLEDKERLNRFVAAYAFAAGVFVVTSPILFVMTRYFLDYLPNIPTPGGEQIPLLGFRPGQFGVHLAGALIFAFLALTRVSVWWVMAMISTATMASAAGRGAMLAIGVPFVTVALLGGRARLLLKLGVAGIAAIIVALIVESFLFEYRDNDTYNSYDRQIGVRQALAGFFSLFDDSRAQLSQTKEWRIKWWDIIKADTLYGAYFWTGKGFGINLADADGFQMHPSSLGPPLRDPHSVHITILARAGVPGLVLWLAVIGSWSWLVLRSSFAARGRGEAHWADFLLFIFGYALAVIVESSFDIGMAGPMIAIPFWCLFGLGIGAATVYRSKMQADDARRLRQAR